MNRLLATALATTVLGGMLTLAPPPASAEPDTRFGSCRQMWAVDPAGVATSNKAIRKALRQGYRAPLLCPIAYDANRRLDRDGDGVACERRR